MVSPTDLLTRLEEAARYRWVIDSNTNSTQMQQLLMEAAMEIKKTEDYVNLRIALRTMLWTNGGPIDGKNTTDGLDYVMVRRDAFDEAARALEASEIRSRTKRKSEHDERGWKPD